MGLKDIGETLPPGFRFYPSDQELVCHYLYRKIAHQELSKGSTLVEIDLHTCEPWQLPELAKLNAEEWYFFSYRDRKYATGFRTNRATTAGYWKATGKDRTIVNPRTGEIVGMRKTLVFYKNRAPNGIKSGWIMHEFRLESPHLPPKEDWVLCRVFNKNKGESSTKVLHVHDEIMLEATLIGQTKPLALSYPNITTSISSTSSTQHHEGKNYMLNLLHFSHHDQDNRNSTISDHDDDYGFIWDMNLQETTLGSTDMEEVMKFDIYA